MRPPELDITFVLHHLDCYATEDDGDGDEPYMWHLGFKIDAETLGPPPSGSLVPSLNVRVIEGPPHFRHVVGAGHVHSSQNQGPAIAANLGTRTMRLKPAFIPLMGWFPGIAGTICLLWDEDGFAPSTSEAGFTKFKAVFGPALTGELNRLVAGDYDDELAKDVNGDIVPDGPDGRGLKWRFARLSDAGGRKHAIDAITGNVKNIIGGPVKHATVDAAGWDELLDPDDLLGVSAQVYTGNELSGTQSYSLTFTDDDANYAARGLVTAFPVHRAVLDSVVTGIERHPDRAVGLWRRVCWGPEKLYWAEAFRVRTSLRYELRNLLGEAPTEIRWFIDNMPLPAGDSLQTVTFDPTSKHFGAPLNALSGFFPGGPGRLKCRVTGNVLDVSNEGGDGVFFGKVKVLYAFAGDPSLSPPPATPIDELFSLGYDRSADLDIVAVSLEMNDEYHQDVAQCARKIREIDLKHIPPNFGKVKIDPGDPPEWRTALADSFALATLVASVAGVDMPSGLIPGLRSAARRRLAPR